MRIAVTGSAGKLGQAVVHPLVEKGHSVTGLDAVVHLAATPAPGIRPDTVLKDNLAMSISVCQAARRAGITKIVHASSEIVHASSETLLGLPLTEDPPAAPIDEQQPVRPNSMYTIGKHLEEELGRSRCRLDSDLSITGLRFSNVMAADDYPGYATYIIAAADTLMRRKSTELMSAEFADVPLARALKGPETLLSIDAARRAPRFGVLPRHWWLDSAE